jgi:hypothetical protein
MFVASFSKYFEIEFIVSTNQVNFFKGFLCIFLSCLICVGIAGLVLFVVKRFGVYPYLL